MISTSDFKRGIRIQLDGEPFVILDVHVQPPSARGASSLTKVKVRNLRTSQVFDKTFRGGEKVEEPNVELRPVQFLYQDRDGYHFMDSQSYDQFALSAEELGDVTGYLTDGLGDIRSVLFNDEVISIELPNTVELEIVETAPVVKGASAQAQTKPAKLSTGIVIQVPAYLESGEIVKVDTREARYLSRGKREG